MSCPPAGVFKRVGIILAQTQAQRVAANPQFHGSEKNKVIILNQV